jgi:hypothetical protein
LLIGRGEGGRVLRKYRDDIREEVFMQAGTTVQSYCDKMKKRDYDEFDAIDEVIITTGRKLKRSHMRVFGMLYKCHSLQKTKDRLEQRGHKAISDGTLRRYMRDSKASIIEFATEEEVTTKIRKVLENEYE